MGPRRFGKTSILSAVEHRVSARGAVVLRCDAEAYETTALLAQALLTGAARKLAGPLDRVGDSVRRVFGRLRPEVEYDLTEQKVSVTIGAVERVEELPALSKVLDRIEAMAAEASGARRPRSSFAPRCRSTATWRTCSLARRRASSRT